MLVNTILNINGVTVSDAGQYTCTVTASYTGSNSAHVIDSTGSGSEILTGINVPGMITAYVTDSTGSGMGTLTVNVSDTITISPISDVTIDVEVSAISDATINVGGSHTFDSHTFTCSAMPPNGLQSSTCSATPPNGLQSSHLSYQWTNPFIISMD
jgi:hypothetical protein